MITVQEAKFIVRSKSGLLPKEVLALREAHGFVSASQVYSPVDFPAFDQSNMDGYAVRMDDLSSGEPLRIVGAAAAGRTDRVSVGPGEAIRIFTGSVVPEHADVVVMQELARVEKESLFIERAGLTRNMHIRARGSDVRSGDLAFDAGKQLTVGAIGFLAALGLTEMEVYRKPRVRILITGNEIRQPGTPLQPGQVYDANSYMLRAALQSLDIREVQTIFIPDDLQKIETELRLALEKSDLVLLTGGISMGDYDFVLKAALNNRVEPLFHKVKQRPGKPLFLGKTDTCLVFGLPGNPSSVLTCFYEYVVPAVEGMTGLKNIMQTDFLPIAHAYQKNRGLTHFLKGRRADGEVIPLEAQESYRLSSFANADCLICLPEDQESWNAGDEVEIHILPGR